MGRGQRPPNSASLVLALDCGTTGNRAIVFDRSQRIIASSYREFTQYYPRPGWVEHDAGEIWCSARQVVKDVLKKVPSRLITAMGITNQRETLVVWNRKTGKPVHKAIVWQCRRSSRICEELKRRGLEGRIHKATGLFLDPYFSASKILWLCRENPAVRSGLRNGNLLCGTIDTWVIWNLTGGKSFSTDPTNASRTLLYNVRTGRWDPELCRIFGVPMRCLAEVLPSLGKRGSTSKKVFGFSVPISGVAGDQQSASFAQGCFKRGVVKNTYGTGLFVVAETGRKMKLSKRLVTTVAVSVGGRLEYALEGSIFIGGAALQWLRDGIKILKSAHASEPLAQEIPSNEGVYFVPALVGLGCPHWDARARGTIVGLTRQTRSAHLVRAALEAMAYQTRDVLDLVHEETKLPIRCLNVDGGAVKNNFLMQFQADILGCVVERPTVTETTALGAAGLAGIAAGLWRSREDFLKSRKVDRIFKPKMKPEVREAYYGGWKRAVVRAKQWA